MYLLLAPYSSPSPSPPLPRLWYYPNPPIVWVFVCNLFQFYYYVIGVSPRQITCDFWLPPPHLHMSWFFYSDYMIWYLKLSIICCILWYVIKCLYFLHLWNKVWIENWIELNNISIYFVKIIPYMYLAIIVIITVHIILMKSFICNF